MIADGVKTVEIRSWRTNHRGPLLVCAGSRPYRGMKSAGPFGCALCVVDVIDCRPATADDAEPAGAEPPDGSFAWVLSAPRPVDQTPVKGRLGLFDV